MEANGAVAPPRALDSWESDAKYRTLFDSIDEGFCVIKVLFDADGTPVDYVFLETNPSFERQTGLVGAIGRSMRALAPAHEEHWFTTYGDIATNGEAIRFDAPAHALGRWYDVYAFRVGEPSQHLVAVLFNDISHRKALEQALESRNARLREADVRKDRFLATLAHELRNPLAPLMIAAELLGHDNLSARQLGQTRDVIRRQVGHMSRLLDDLLDVARITQGKLVLRKQGVPLAEVIDSAMEAVRPLMERKHHSVAVHLDPAVGIVDVDPVRFSQVIANLLTNAAKYTDPGGRIVVRTRAEPEAFVLEIEDNGIGIQPDALPDLFVMFSQVADGADRTEGGLGIGLSLVKGLVELHGGSVQAESAGAAQGSTFRVRMPLSRTQQMAVPDTVPRQAVARRRVLVADDNRDAADTIGMLIGDLGHEVRIVYDGQAAVSAARIFHPDMALLDIGMPKIDGCMVARALRQEPWAGSLLLVAATGWG
ncbi:MAG: ATP-binding protein, partial [Betaproteobacteria bacterium]